MVYLIEKGFSSNLLSKLKNASVSEIITLAFVCVSYTYVPVSTNADSLLDPCSIHSSGSL